MAIRSWRFIVLVRITKAKGSADHGDSPAVVVDSGLVNDRADALARLEMPHKFSRALALHRMVPEGNLRQAVVMGNALKPFADFTRGTSEPESGMIIWRGPMAVAQVDPYKLE